MNKLQLQRQDTQEFIYINSQLHYIPNSELLSFAYSIELCNLPADCSLFEFALHCVLLEILSYIVIVEKAECRGTGKKEKRGRRRKSETTG